MHEASIARGILDTAARALPSPADGQPPRRVRGVRVVAGVFSGCERESLEQAFAAVTAGTVLEGATLEIVRRPARLICRACGFARDYNDTGDFAATCEHCGGQHRMEGGNELFLESMDVEESHIAT